MLLLFSRAGLDLGVLVGRLAVGSWKESVLGTGQSVCRGHHVACSAVTHVPIYLPLEALEWIIICDSVISREFSSGADLTALEIDTLTWRLSIFMTFLLYPLHAKKYMKGSIQQLKFIRHTVKCREIWKECLGPHSRASGEQSFLIMCWMIDMW